jgi:hypothetical protein
MMLLLVMILLTYIALMSSPSLVWIVGNISERSATANHRYAVGAAFFGVLSVR